MIYEVAIGVGTIIFLTLLWTLLMHPINTLVTSFKNITPSSSFNETVNQTVIFNNYDTAYNVGYLSLFFIALIVFVWLIKTSISQQKPTYYGG